MFCSRSGLKTEWIDTELSDNTARWRSYWFYIADQRPVLPKHTGPKPMKIPECDLQLSSHEMDDVKEVLALVGDLKERGVAGGFVTRSF
jgi:hypothetical protein